MRPVLADGRRTLGGTRVRLVPVAPDHYEFLRVAEIERLGVWWRNRGTEQSPEQFASRVWAGVLTQFIGVGLEDEQPLVWAQCYNADPVNATAAIAVARLDTGLASLRVGTALALFVNHLFQAYGFRKLYAEVAAPNVSGFESLRGPLLVEEARLAGHLQSEPGEYCDLHMLALWRFAWDAYPLRELLLGRA